MNILQRIKNWWNRLVEDQAPLMADDYDTPIWGDEGTQPLGDPCCDFEDPLDVLVQKTKKRGRPRKNEARDAEIANALWRDESYEDVARKFKLSRTTVVKIATRYAAIALRDSNIARSYKAGNTMQSIGDGYDLTRERIRQILKAQGVKSRPRGRK